MNALPNTESRKLPLLARAQAQIKLFLATWPFRVLLGTWVLPMISVPILFWMVGESAIPPIMNIAVVFQVGAALVALRQAWPVRRIALTAGGVAALAWLVEYVGSSTGFPFGRYGYTDLLQPQLGGVPLLVPLAWLMMLPSAWGIAALLVRNVAPPYRRLAFIAVSALAMTAWDLFLDPQMVTWGFWVWKEPGAYFGIPLANYAGWLLASAVITTAVHPPVDSLRRAAASLLLIYAITWFLETVGLGLFWGQPGPALFGSLAMGAMMILAFRALYAKTHP